MSTRQYYFEMFNELKDLYSEEIIELDFYEGKFAKLYDTFPIVNDEFDIYISEALQCGKNVFELCCGNGRLTIPFAKYGFNIDGIDSSEDMLQCLDERKKLLPKTIQKRINCVQGNIFEAEIDKEYDFIFLPATTISILADDEGQLIKLFSKMYDILNDNGSFVFDSRDEIDKKRRKSDIFTKTDKQTDCKSLTIFQEFFSYINGRTIGNFYSQVEDGKEIKRYITSTNKKIITEEFVKRVAEKSSFEIYKKLNSSHDDSNVTFWVLKKKGKYNE
ncbi:MAG: class I SAM-dependent methyltransferase [Deltaproteobacteria bacterium]|nr:class I SAM-dependent methyltransferase [Deltaproteobacteria bacterium]